MVRAVRSDRGRPDVPPVAGRALRIFLDWDGTVTVRDSLVQVIHEFGDPALLAELEPRVGVDLTLHEEIALEFQQVKAPLADVVAWVLQHVEVRPGLRDLAERHAPVVISAGFCELIEPVLARDLDDGKYAYSWYETGDEAPSDAGLTSHL